MCNSNEVKIKLADLQVGMFVSRTDRAWEDLPVQLEGVVINSNDEIDMLNKYCRSVYIDISKGKAASPMSWVTEKPVVETKRIITKESSEFSLLRKEDYQSLEPLDTELKKAEQIYLLASKKIHKVFEGIRKNKETNLCNLEEVVSQTVDSVLRNPTAMRLIIELHKTNEYNCNHALSTSIWCTLFGRHLGLEKSSIFDLAFGGLLLDIGKIKISDALFEKNGRLTTEEIKLLRSHVDIAIQMLINNHDISHNVMRMVASHHERANGSGYPQGLKNNGITIFARIAGIVDSFDAMISKRPFSSVILSPHEAIRDLYEQRDILFQADLIEQFIQTMGMYPTGTLVELSNNEIAVVTEIHGLKRLKPTVMVILDKNKCPLDEFNSINLSQQNTLSIKSSLPLGAFGIMLDELFI